MGLPKGLTLIGEDETQKALPPGLTLEEKPSGQPAPPQASTHGAEYEVPEGAAGIGKFLVGLGENILTLGTGAFSEPVAGIAGLASLVVPKGEEGRLDRADKIIKAVQEAMTYQPKSASGKNTQNVIGGEATQIAEVLEKPVEAAAEKASEIGGPEVGGAVGSMIKTTAGGLAELAGVRGLRAAPKARLSTTAGTPTSRLAQAAVDTGLKAKDIGSEGMDLVKNLPADSDPQQVARAAFLHQQGFKGDTAPTKAQITRTTSDFRTQQELANETGQVQGRLENQNALLKSKFTDAAKATGGNVPKTGDIQLKNTTGSPVADRVLDKATELDNDIYDMYQQAKKATKNEPLVRPRRFSQALESAMSDNDLTGGLVKAIEGAAQRRGAVDKKGVIGEITVEQAENIVKAINARYKTGNPNANRVGRKLKDAIDLDVAEAGGEGLFKKARERKAAFHKELIPERSKFSKRKASLPLDILEERIQADDLFSKGILSNKYNEGDIQHLKRYLHSGTPAQKAAGVKAWNDMRAEAIEWIRDQSFDGPHDSKGNRRITRYRFEKAIKKFGTMKKLKEIFTPQEVKFLGDMQKTLEMLEPSPGTFKGGGPSSPGINRAMKSIERRLEKFQIFKPFKTLVLDPEGKALMATPETSRPRSLSLIESAATGAVASFAMREREEN